MFWRLDRTTFDRSVIVIQPLDISVSWCGFKSSEWRAAILASASPWHGSSLISVLLRALTRRCELYEWHRWFTSIYAYTVKLLLLRCWFHRCQAFRFIFMRYSRILRGSRWRGVARDKSTCKFAEDDFGVWVVMLLCCWILTEYYWVDDRKHLCNRIAMTVSIGTYHRRSKLTKLAHYSRISNRYYCFY